MPASPAPPTRSTPGTPASPVWYHAGSIYASINAANGANSAAILYQVQPFVIANPGGANDGQIAGVRILNEFVHSGAFDAYYATQQPDLEGNVTYVWNLCP
jgi:hypothetical protein